MALLNDILTLNDFKQSQSLDETNKIWFAIMKMDLIEIFKALKTVTSKDFSKESFLNDLSLKFKKHNFLGDNEFYMSLVECPDKHNGEIICEFVGLESAINLGLYFQYFEGEIINISFCNCLGGIDDLNDYYSWE